MEFTSWYGHNALIVYHPSQIPSTIDKNLEVILLKNHYNSNGLYTPEAISWYGSISDFNKPCSAISTKEQKILAKNTSQLQNQGFQITTNPLTKTNFRQFEALFNQHFASKPGFIGVSLFKQTLAKLKLGYKVILFGVYYQNQLKAGLIGYHVKNEFHITVGAKEHFHQLKGGLGGVLETQLLAYCAQEKIYLIKHGTGVNPVGITTNLGLFEFKARYGFSAYPSGPWQTVLWLQPPSEDQLYLSLNSDQLGYLLVTHQPNSHASKLYSTFGVSSVVNVSWDQVIHQSTSFIQTLTSTDIQMGKLDLI